MGTEVGGRCEKGSDHIGREGKGRGTKVREILGFFLIGMER